MAWLVAAVGEHPRLIALFRDTLTDEEGADFDKALRFALSFTPDDVGAKLVQAFEAALAAGHTAAELRAQAGDLIRSAGLTPEHVDAWRHLPVVIQSGS